MAHEEADRPRSASIRGAAEPGHGGPLEPGSPRGTLAILVLVLVSTVNAIDRQLPFILVDPIKAELGLSDTQVGLMAGLAFAVVYSFAGLPLARLADRGSPRRVLVASLAIWSLATAVTGGAQNFIQLILCRIGVAASEAGSMPAAHALIARTFPTSRRAAIVAAFSLGVPIGSTLGLALGGWINDVANWRSAFFIVGLPGLLIAAGAMIVLPPLGQRASAIHPGTPSFPQSIRRLLAFRSFRHLAAASSLFACGSYGLNVFAPAFLIRTHNLSTAAAGVGVGLAFGIGGGIGTFAGGLLGDRLGRRNAAWRAGVPAIGQFLCIPLALSAWLADDATLSIVLLSTVYLCGLLYFAPTFAAIQYLVPDSGRAMASAVLLFCLTLVGSSIGPMAIGWASDRLAPIYGQMSLRYAMCLMAVTMFWSGVHFMLAARALAKDINRAQGRCQSSANQSPLDGARLQN